MTKGNYKIWKLVSLRAGFPLPINAGCPLGEAQGRNKFKYLLPLLKVHLSVDLGQMAVSKVASAS